MSRPNRLGATQVLYVRLPVPLMEMLDAYALRRGLLHGGKPWRAEALREIIYRFHLTIPPCTRNSP